MLLALEQKSDFKVAPHRRAQVALKAFFRIAELWGLSAQEEKRLLGIEANSTFYNYKKGEVGTLSSDILERISYILGIYQSLQVLFPDSSNADLWIRKANDAPLFGGATALERMLLGRVSDLYVVQQYLEAECGTWM